MASLIKVVFVLIVLSIAADFINLKGYWFNTERNGEEITVHSYSLFLPGANAFIGRRFRAPRMCVSKSAQKAAKKKAKNRDRVEGNAKNKAKKGSSEHTKDARKSTKDKHQKGQTRKNKEQQKSNKKKG